LRKTALDGCGTAKITNFGPRKTERYGSAVLEIIERFRTHPFTVPESPIPLTAPEREALALRRRGCDPRGDRGYSERSDNNGSVTGLGVGKTRRTPILEEWMPRHRYDQIQQTGAKVGWSD